MNVRSPFLDYSFKMVRSVALLLSIYSVNGFAQEQEEGVVVLSDTVTGNQEQPKVLYIVPWQPATDDTILELPLVTRLQRDVFEHIERPQHVRELHYLQSLIKKEQ